MIDVRATAVQGIGFDARQVAIHGLYPTVVTVTEALPVVALGGRLYTEQRRPEPVRNLPAAARNEEEEIIEILTMTIIAIEGAGLWQA